jgi:hypothetical protein
VTRLMGPSGVRQAARSGCRRRACPLGFARTGKAGVLPVGSRSSDRVRSGEAVQTPLFCWRYGPAVQGRSEDG